MKIQLPESCITDPLFFNAHFQPVPESLKHYVEKFTAQAKKDNASGMQENSEDQLEYFVAKLWRADVLVPALIVQLMPVDESTAPENIKTFSIEGDTVDTQVFGDADVLTPTNWKKIWGFGGTHNSEVVITRDGTIAFFIIPSFPTTNTSQRSGCATNGRQFDQQY